MLTRVEGFTLIELVIVIAIVGILAAISVPAWLNWYNSSEYREAAQIAGSALMQAKGRAINSNRQIKVRFDISQKRAETLFFNQSTNAWQSIETVQFGDNINIKGLADCDSESTVSITFNPDGTSQSGYVCIMNGTQKRFRSGVGNTASSRILIQRWDGSSWK